MNFSPDYIEKYVKGKLSAEEMHSLEKAMQSNPFLAEAIEGISENLPPGTSVPLATHLEYLQKQFPHYQTTKPLFKGQTVYRLVAGVVLLLVMLSLIWFFIQPKEKNYAFTKAIAQAEKATEQPQPIFLLKEEKELLAPTPTEDNDAPDAKPTTETTISSTNQTTKITKQNQPLMQNTPLPLTNDVLPKTEKNVAIDSEIDNNSSNKVANEKQATEAGDEELSKKTSDKEQEKPASLNDKNKATLQSTKVYGATKDDLKRDTNTAANKASVDTKMTRRRETEQQADQLLLLDKSQTIHSTTSAIPAQGWEVYQQYLETNKKNVTTAKGTVVLEITINKKGKVTTTKVIKSLNSEADSEAARLVKEGGKWKFITEQVTTKLLVEVKF